MVGKTIIPLELFEIPSGENSSSHARKNTEAWILALLSADRRGAWVEQNQLIKILEVRKITEASSFRAIQKLVDRFVLNVAWSVDGMKLLRLSEEIYDLIWQAVNWTCLQRRFTPVWPPESVGGQEAQEPFEDYTVIPFPGLTLTREDLEKIPACRFLMKNSLLEPATISKVLWLMAKAKWEEYKYPPPCHGGGGYPERGER